VIVTFDELPHHRGAGAMVAGAFDPLHAGHIEYFRQAAALGRPVLCNVASDAYVRTKHEPFLPAAERAAIIDAIRYIAFTHPSATDTATVLRHLRPTCYVKGKDWEGRLPDEQVALCREHGIAIVYLDTVRDSSSRILETFLQRTARA
jgi:cytidyltransferase-like protein